jgi:hypothetical protein
LRSKRSQPARRLIDGLHRRFRRRISAIAIRYLGEEGGRAFVRDFEPPDNALFTIRPDRWLSADFAGDL